MEYKVAQNFSLDHGLTTLEKFGAEGYNFIGTAITIANDGGNTSSGLFIKIGESKLPYQVRLDLSAPTIDSYRTQLNTQGAKGYRYSTYLFNGTAYFPIYVRDASRPSAKYIYQFGRCASNMTELFAQINKYSAQGYRLFRTLFFDDKCIIYIKDASKKSQFVYKMVPDFNTTADFLAKSNELGAQGYRHPSVVTTNLVSNGVVSNQLVPLYYRDKTQTGCTFSYTSAPRPDSIDKYLALLQNQAAKGFIRVRTLVTITGRVIIFVKIHNCEYKSMNLDASYWF